MLIMDPNGSIEPCDPAPVASGRVDMAVERVFMLSEELGHDIATEVRAMVEARLVALSERLGPVPGAAGWSMAG